ncbi:MAG: TatD family hydrolase [Bacillota bacterium]|nr:TatD family hydrolase [Bacillota bacterium]
MRGCWWDTHAHVMDQAFAADGQEVLAQAWDAGLEGIIAVGYDAATSRQALVMARREPRLYPTVGLHPQNAHQLTDQREALESLAATGSFVAVGETGLDFHYDDPPREAQEEALLFHWELARQLDLPLIFHVRDSAAHLLDWIGRHPLPRAGVWHAFTGTREEAWAALNLGLYLGVGGILTFKNARDLREVVADLPRERVVVETDAPYLAPVPHRGKRNQPGWVVETGKALAALWDTTPEEVACLTRENARALFGIRP